MKGLRNPNCLMVPVGRDGGSRERAGAGGISSRRCVHGVGREAVSPGSEPPAALREGGRWEGDGGYVIHKLSLDSIVPRLLEVRGSNPDKNVQLQENEIRGPCLKSERSFSASLS